MTLCVFRSIGLIITRSLTTAVRQTRKKCPKYNLAKGRIAAVRSQLVAKSRRQLPVETLTGSLQNKNSDIILPRSGLSGMGIWIPI